MTGLTSRINDQMSSLERSTMNKVSSIQNEINTIREFAHAHKNSPQKGKGVSNEELQNFTGSVDFLKNISSSCQEQILALQNQISLLRGERTAAVGNENHLRQLEIKVEELKKALGALNQRMILPSSSPHGTHTDYTASTLHQSSSGNALSGLHQHKNPFNEGTASASDLSKKIDAALSLSMHNPYPLNSDYKPHTSDLAGYSSHKPPTDLKTSDYLKNSSYMPGTISSPNNKTPTPSAVSTNKHTTTTVQSTFDNQNKPYYGDPKIKNLIEELTRGKKSDVFAPNGGSDRSK